MKTTMLYGLVLSGGKSTRMGIDKGTISYHGKPQRERLYDLLQPYCDRVFLSIRPGQEKEISSQYEYITDENRFKGPFNGMLSAHNAYPNVGWLVLACDLPLLNASAIEHLIANRDLDKTATSFAKKGQSLPEPLIAIWEPQALQTSKTYLENAISTCPRKFLINSDTKLVYIQNEMVLFNANDRADYEHIISKL
ncbi:MAG: molybdenum cofactor guanylyltransferase [Flavobacteriaceae bacterium]